MDRILKFSFQTLKKTYQNAKLSYDKEHVTPYIIRNKKFKKYNYENKIDYSEFRWSLDELEDLKVIRLIYEEFKPNIYFSWEDAIKKVLKKKQLTSNKHLLRNEGARMNKTQKLWKRAKSLIPGGNMILSKRPELFHPDLWPAYFNKAKGCEIWDLDGKNILIYRLWELDPIYLDMQTQKLIMQLNQLFQKVILVL